MSGISALALWGLSDARPAVIDVASAERIQKRLDDVAIHHLPLLDRDVTRLGPVPIVTVAWGISDVAGSTPMPDLEDMYVQALRRWHHTDARLADVIERRPLVPGVENLRQLRDLTDPEAVRRLMSWLEAQYLLLFARMGLPPPQVNRRLHDEHGQLVAKIDFWWPDARLVVEVDGLRWHSTPRQKHRDDTRQNRLVLRGQRVLRYGRIDLEEPDRVAAEVAAGFAMSA